MNFSKEKKNNNSNFLAPFLDVMFLLLSFFMIDSIFNQLGSKMGINLPSHLENKKKENIESGNELIINIDKNGNIEINKTKLTLKDLLFILNQAQGEFGRVNIAIRADKDSRYGTVLNILDICYKNNITEISIYRQ